MHAKQQHIKESITTRKIQFNYHDADTSYLEAVFARGDRKLCKAMEIACEKGFHFDGWGDCFDLQKWLDILKSAALTRHSTQTVSVRLTRYFRGITLTTA